jgi:ABC-type polysaccharide transport system, permease component
MEAKANAENTISLKPKEKLSFSAKLKKEWKRNYFIYLILLPVVVYYIVFHYVPMYGIIIAWKKFMPTKGIIGSPWIGWTNFTNFFNSYYFVRLLKNTFVISLYGMIFGFPAPIIFALMLNELKDGAFKRISQTITYLPHFISEVIICGMLVDFLAPDGLINTILSVFGVQPTAWLQQAGAFRTIFVTSGIWQGLGWSSIMYLAALSNVNTELYDAAYMDGASRFQRMLNVTIPGILPTIIIMFILRLGHLLSVGAEKVILLYNPNTYATADVISSFVYRRGLLDADYSFTTAIGLFNSLINFMFLIAANYLSRKTSETSLW